MKLNQKRSSILYLLRVMRMKKNLMGKDKILVKLIMDLRNLIIINRMIPQYKNWKEWKFHKKLFKEQVLKWIEEKSEFMTKKKIRQTIMQKQKN